MIKIINPIPKTTFQEIPAKIACKNPNDNGIIIIPKIGANIANNIIISNKPAKNLINFHMMFLFCCSIQIYKNSVKNKLLHQNLSVVTRTMLDISFFS